MTTTVTLPGRAFATAWLNTSLAASKDAGRPQLYLSVLVELFHDARAAQLVATDSYLLLTSLVEDPDVDLAPIGLDEVPDESVVAIDYDGRMSALMKFVLKDAIRAEKAKHDPPTVKLTVKSAETAGVPTLAPELDRRVLVVETDRERLSLDVYDGTYPDWRKNLVAAAAAELLPSDSIAFSADILARLGQLKETAANPVEFTLSGPRKPVGVIVRCEPLVQGIAMPARPFKAVELEDDDGTDVELGLEGVDDDEGDLE